MLTFHAIGDWAPGRVRLDWTARPLRRIQPEVERIIDDAWAHVTARPGVHLFDGPMCRLEAFDASPSGLRLSLSPTSYKPFVGTNLQNPALADSHGRQVMANPVGVSALLETADGYFMLGRRNASVAYYPERVHPFAGALEPRDGADPFAAVYRELAEELSLARADVTDVRCTGLVEDRALRQPELIFLARTALPRAEVERRVDRGEHHASCALQRSPAQVLAWTADPALTPVAVASLLLAGRLRFDQQWFEAAVAAPPA
jgi:hypothetical protein